MARAVGHEAVVQQANLHEVLADSANLDVIVVRLRHSAQKVHGVRIAKIVVEGREDEALGAEDLGLAEAIVRNMAEISNVGR